MNTFALILILFVLPSCSTLDISQFNGPIILPLTSTCCDTTVSSDASFFYCSSNSAAEILVFKNSGHGFEPFETIHIPTRSCYLAIDEKEERLLYQASNRICVLERHNGTYQKVMQINGSSSFRRILVVDEFIVTGLRSGKINFYHRLDYGLARTLISSSSSI